MLEYWEDTAVLQSNLHKQSPVSTMATSQQQPFFCPTGIHTYFNLSQQPTLQIEMAT